MRRLRVIFVVVLIGLVAGAIYWLYPSPKIFMGYCVAEDFSSPAEFRARIKKLNLVAYAFLQVDPDGKLLFAEDDLSFSEKNVQFCQSNRVHCQPIKRLFNRIGNLEYFANLVSPTKQLKKIVSLGGADHEESFTYAINHIDEFVDSLQLTLTTFNLDGVDLDFEVNRPYQLTEALLYTELIRRVRLALGNDAIISMTTVVDGERINSLGATNWQQIAKQADFIALMCYDLALPLVKPYYSQFSSNLYLINAAPPILHNHNLSCDQSIRLMQSLGVATNKVILGVPAYGVAFGGVEAVDNGLFQPSDPTKTPRFDDMWNGLLRYATVRQLLQSGFKQHVYTANGPINGVWAYNPTTHQLITYDNPDSIREKVHYVSSHHLAGMMLWRIGQDAPLQDKNSLIRAISKAL